MATILGERKVIFSGLWRSSPRTDVDRQLRLISEEYQKKPGLPASFQITPVAVELHIISENGKSARNMKIEFKDIYDVMVNKYHPLCLMVVYSDLQNSHNFLACQCYKESDGIQMNKVYRECKMRNSSRSSPRPDPHRQNWVLKPKPVSNNNEGESDSLTSNDKEKGLNGVERPNVLHTSSLDSSGYHSVEVHRSDSSLHDDEVSMDSRVTDSLPSPSGNFYDGDSLVSMESYNSMKEELLNLSQEVRNIKSLLLQQGIDPDSFQNVKGHVNGHTEIEEKHSPSSDRHVNFAIDETKGLNDSGRKGLYVKRPAVLTHSTRGKLPVRAHHYRTGSSNSASTPSPVYVGANEVFDYHQKPLQTVQVVSGPVPQRRGSQNAVSSTIHKPIEQVYQMQPRQSHSHRRQIVLHPGQSSTLPAMRRHADSDHVIKNGNF
ncbi:hypothetical protein LOTGIDRAFT_171043 [Lottia gigantea]|uniref:Uncharacterized protein n=1 Tax=Lottia gigantea TaxID=225164 RepID=V4CP58_LOTGI|nr:hypothetical protein LOTGIDRAFT_171043 [Lottia gigantea]ESP04205.1 hypothetical protein LOTGIDRAFT_171043 [Lottia gigantea]